MRREELTDSHPETIKAKTRYAEVQHCLGNFEYSFRLINDVIAECSAIESLDKTLTLSIFKCAAYIYLGTSLGLTIQLFRIIMKYVK